MSVTPLRLLKKKKKKKKKKKCIILRVIDYLMHATNFLQWFSDVNANHRFATGWVELYIVYIIRFHI